MANQQSAFSCKADTLKADGLILQEGKIWKRNPGTVTMITMFPPPFAIPGWPIHELFRIPANAYPDKAALNFFGTEMTFWELRLQILRMANALGALGVKKGERVGIHLPNCPQYPIAYYAVLSLGAIVVNLNPMYTADELKMMASTTGLTTLITFDMVLPTIRVLCKEFADPPGDRNQGYGLYQGHGCKHRRQPGPGKRVASFFHPAGWCHQHEAAPGPGKPGRPGLDSVHRRNDGNSQGSGPHPRERDGRSLSNAPLGEPHHLHTPPERRIVMAVLPYFHVYGNIVVMNWAMFSCATQIRSPVSRSMRSWGSWPTSKRSPSSPPSPP